MRAVPDQIRQWVPAGFTSLGTDGFGLSDTRPALRRHFHVDAESIVVAALATLAAAASWTGRWPAEAAAKYRIDDPQAAGPQTSDPGSPERRTRAHTAVSREPLNGPAHFGRGQRAVRGHGRAPEPGHSTKTLVIAPRQERSRTVRSAPTPAA